MINRTKFSFFLILIMINSSIFSEDSISSEEIFLNCTLGIDIHEIDIDIDNVTGKWVPYTSIIFTENSSDPQYRLSVDKNWTNVLFGKKPYDFIEIDLLTLKATSAILSGMEGDSIGGGMGSDDLGGSMEGDGLFGGMEGDSIGGGMGSDGLGGSMDGDGLFGGMEGDSIGGSMEGDGLGGGMEGDSIGGGMGSDGLGGSMEGDGLFGGMEGDSIGGGMGSDGLGGSMDGDGLVGGIREGFCEIVPSRKNNS